MTSAQIDALYGIDRAKPTARAALTAARSGHADRYVRVLCSIALTELWPTSTADRAALDAAGWGTCTSRQAWRACMALGVL